MHKSLVFLKIVSSFSCEIITQKVKKIEKNQIYFEMSIIYQIYTENQVFTGIVKPSQGQLQKTSFLHPLYMVSWTTILLVAHHGIQILYNILCSGYVTLHGKLEKVKTTAK